MYLPDRGISLLSRVIDYVFPPCGVLRVYEDVAFVSHSYTPNHFSILFGAVWPAHPCYPLEVRLGSDQSYGGWRWGGVWDAFIYVYMKQGH